MSAADRALNSGRVGDPWRQRFTVAVSGGATIDLDAVVMQIRRGPTETHPLVATSYAVVDEPDAVSIDLTGTSNADDAFWWAITDDDTATIAPGDLWCHAKAPVNDELTTIAYFQFKAKPRVLVP